MRRLLLVALLIGSIGIPYLVLSGGEGNLLSSMWHKLRGDAEGAESGAPSLAQLSSVAIANGDTPVAVPAMDYGMEVAPTMQLDQALNFQVSIPWVLGNWPQVSTGMIDKNLFGYRVPLVTGTAEDDVTGSLTYYFGPDKVLRRITLEGDTGDARKLVSWLSARFGMARYLSNEQGVFLYQAMESNRVVNQLKIRPQEIVRADVPHQRFEVLLTLERPAEQKSSWFSRILAP